MAESRETQDAKLRGRVKLAGISPDVDFAKVRRPAFYVTQPMRMGIVQPLSAQGFAEGSSSRFNSYQVTKVGERFVDTSLDGFRPYRRTVDAHLRKWISGQESRNDTTGLRHALSLLKALSTPARDILTERLQSGIGRERRVAAMKWLRRLTKTSSRSSWRSRPPKLSTEHWHDLAVGARFFALRDNAINALNEIERAMGESGRASIKVDEIIIRPAVVARLKKVKAGAEQFLQQPHTIAGVAAAGTFAQTFSNPTCMLR